MPRGRISIKGSQSQMKEGSRNKSSIEERISVVKCYFEHGMDDTMKKFFVDLSGEKFKSKRRNVYEWIKWYKENQHLKLTATQLNGSWVRPKGLTLVSPPEAELLFSNWIRSLRSQGIRVSQTMAKEKAKL